MNLSDLLNGGSSVSITVALNDLKHFHDWAIQEAKQQLEQAISHEKSEVYLSPEKVCEMLDVNRSTLWRWDKKGYLSTIEVGGKRRYRMSDIKKLLKG